MQRKKCTKDGCNNPSFSKLLCKWHYQQENAQKFAIKKTSVKKSSTKIKQVSDKQKKRLEEYYKLRDEFMKDKKCERCGTSHNLTLHHRAGRIGENLFKYFCTLCLSCHEFIHSNPSQGEKEGFIISRLK